MVENIGQSIYWLNEKIYVTLDPDTNINSKLLEKKIWVSSFCLRNARKRDTKTDAGIPKKEISFILSTYIYCTYWQLFFFGLTCNK